MNSIYNALALINSKCLCYALVSKKFARQSRLERYTITPRTIEGIDRKLSEIKEVSKFEFNMHSHQEVAYAYIINNIEEEIILGKG